MKTKNQEQVAEQADRQESVSEQLLQAIGGDGYAGRGGSYLFNVDTGKRVPTQETQESHAAEQGGEA